MKANEITAMLEVIAIVILRCHDKDAIEEAYMVNLLYFDDPDVGFGFIHESLLIQCEI